MRDHCWRSGSPPHEQDRSSTVQSITRDADERETDPSAYVSTYTGPPLTLAGCLSTLGTLGVLGYLVLTAAAWVNADSLCFFNQRSEYWRSYYCGKAEMSYPAFFLAAGNPTPPGWRMIDGEPSRIEPLVPATPPPDNRPYYARAIPEDFAAEAPAESGSVVTQRLDGVAQSLAAGFRRVDGVEDEVAVLTAGSPHIWTVQLTSGIDYRIVGACGEGCSDLDLFILSQNGNVIDTHESSAGDPVLRFEVAESGTYIVKILAFTCAETSCIGSARLLRGD